MNILIYFHRSKYIDSDILLFNVLLSFVIGMDGAESLYGRGGERDPGRSTHVLHPLHLANAPLENTRAKRKHGWFLYFMPLKPVWWISDCDKNKTSSYDVKV